MSKRDDLVKRCAALALYDAAYEAWEHRRELVEVTPAPVAVQDASLHNPEFRSLVRKTIRHLLEERETADSGPLFDLLLQSHPGSKPDEIRKAIRAAVKLDRDSVHYFKYEGKSYFDDVRNAAAKAREQNPGFSEETYRSVERELRIAMR